MLSLVLALALLQQPKPEVVKISPASSKQLKEAVQKVKDLQTQIEVGQKDAQNLLLRVVIETLKANPGFNEQEYSVTLEDDEYVFKRNKETPSVKTPPSSNPAPPPNGSKRP